jgi:hypothetical protein
MISHFTERAEYNSSSQQGVEENILSRSEVTGDQKKLRNE